MTGKDTLEEDALMERDINLLATDILNFAEVVQKHQIRPVSCKGDLEHFLSVVRFELSDTGPDEELEDFRDSLKNLYDRLGLIDNPAYLSGELIRLVDKYY